MILFCKKPRSALLRSSVYNLKHHKGLDQGQRVLLFVGKISHGPLAGACMLTVLSIKQLAAISWEKRRSDHLVPIELVPANRS